MKFWQYPFLLLLAAAHSGCAHFHARGIQYKIEHKYSTRNPQFLRSMGQLMGAPMVGGNRITGLANGVQIFPAMLAAIRGAQKTINLETYIYWSGDIGDQIAEALAERARAGVKVHVLFDWFGTRRIDSEQIDRMREAGVEARKYNPLISYNLARFNHRDHRKLLVVDGRIGFIGGTGIADLWEGNADTPDHWRDTHFRLEGPAVAQMQAAFMENWMKTSAQVLDGEEYFPELKPVGDDYAQVFFSSPRDGTESVRLMYLLSIAAARNNIRIATPYFVPGELTEEELVAACQRGVKVEIIMPGARTDAPAVRNASRARWERLLKAGVRFYEYEPTMYHCKMMIVDDIWVSVGSANFDNRSFRLNDEANLNVFSAEFAAEQIRAFEADKAKCREITYDRWKHRSTGKRLMEILTAPFRSQL
ncbi:MAG: cardiolipin synthase B [Pedosphaera parvula]|nr:cardiolipin synthase B [Pedosphaera parvula]